MVLPTSSPSPLRNSPGFPPGSPRPHRGRTMHVTHVSTCDTQIATRRPPAPCRSRLISPLSQARRARGTLQHVDLGGAAGAVPRTPVVIRFDKTPRATPRGKPHDPRHICHGDERATPRIADKIHHSAPGTATGWPPPMGRGRSQEATTAKTVDAADERMRTRSRHRNVPRDAWYFAPPWYFGSTRPSVPRPVADPTVSNTSATNVSSYAGHSSTWTCRARSEAVLRTPVVFRFDKPPRATPRGKPHDPQHICHRIAGPRPARQTGPPPHPGPRTLSLTLRNLQCK